MSATVYFSSGTVINKQTVIISAGFLAAPDAATSRIYLKFGTFWAAHEVPRDFIVSLTFSKVHSRLFALGKNGLVKFVGEPNQPFTIETVRGRFQETQLQPATQRGSMSCIRAVRDGVFICGWGGQIYALQGGQWNEFAEGIPQQAGNDFLDLDGGSTSDMYVVGMSGTIYHHDDNKSWRRLDFPSNAHLYSVRYVSPEEVYVAGANGALFKGCKDKWDFVGNEDVKGNFWGLEKFGEELYATHANTEILRLDANGLSNVDFGLSGKPTTNKLHANDGVLWSFGSYDLLEYDGVNWKPITCPDNE
jgi:hypothetical protein